MPVLTGRKNRGPGSEKEAITNILSVGVEKRGRISEKVLGTVLEPYFLYGWGSSLAGSGCDIQGASSHPAKRSRFSRNTLI
jgi:hypothetical protein